ncbi:MAG: hypothetical protein IPO63_04440 [Bacteroidetes bacterium]|nr:hypothetical protein [Bacteroidota bacterium]
MNILKGIIIFFLFILGVPAIACSNFNVDDTIRDSITVSKKMGIGLHVSYHYNYPNVHSTPAVVFTYKNSAFIMGPCLTQIKSNTLVYSVSPLEQESGGAMFGYMYTYNQVKGPVVPFFQTYFYGYEVYTIEHALAYTAKHKRLVIENTAGFGVKIKAVKSFEIQFAGIGSANGFFLIIDQFVPLLNMGLQYRFR